MELLLIFSIFLHWCFAFFWEIYTGRKEPIHVYNIVLEYNYNTADDREVAMHAGDHCRTRV